MLLKLKDDGALSKFAFNFNSRRYSVGEKIYNDINEFSTLQKILEDTLSEYNETNATMDLVLFEAGAYTRPLLSSTWAVSVTKHTLNTRSYALIPPNAS